MAEFEGQRPGMGMAGEFGHVSIREDGPVCSCGNRGCWEVYASNTATINYYSEATIKSQSERNQKAVNLPTFEDILKLCEQGDPRAVLEQLAAELQWPTQRERVVAAARGIYRGQPAGVPTWSGYRRVERLDISFPPEWIRPEYELGS